MLICLVLIFFKIFLCYAYQVPFNRSKHEAFKVKNLPLGEGVPKKLDLGYSGHIPVRHGDGDIFFWYFEAKKSKGSIKDTPLVIWLQGGPGASSMIGLFNMHGPLKINQDNKIIENPYTWNENYATLYIDQPVGTGFSKVNAKNIVDSKDLCYTKDGYVAEQCGVAKDLIAFLKKFAKLFPETHQRPIYITGESYAGKYIPLFANAILDYNEQIENEKVFNLKGIAIGNGLTDPVSQIKVYGPLALSYGLVTPKQSRHIDNLAVEAIKLLKENNFELATDKRDDIFSYFKNVTYDADFYDVREGAKHLSWEHMEKFLNLDKIKRNLHVGSTTFNAKGSLIKDKMKADGMKSVTYLFPKLNNIKKLFFQGQFDYRDGAMSQMEWLYHQYPCLEESSRFPWKSDTELVGYNTTCLDNKVSHVVVLGAGHRVGYDQPYNLKKLISWFINW